MNYFIYNGVNSLTMGLRIQSKNVFSAPKRDMQFKSINGRNGDLILSNNRYENIDVSYTVFVVAKTISELADKLTAIKQWLYSSADSYATLEDSYDSKFERRAVFSKSLDIEDELNKIGVFTINFSCQPFRFSKLDRNGIEVTSFAYEIENPYAFESLPYIKLLADGNVTLTIQHESNTSTWNFSSVDSYIEIDSEQMNFFKGNQNKNSTVVGYGFPKFLSGTTTITVSGDVDKLVIYPRWCCL